MITLSNNNNETSINVNEMQLHDIIKDVIINYKRIPCI